jgi:hypothetical protein
VWPSSVRLSTGSVLSPLGWGRVSPVAGRLPRPFVGGAAISSVDPEDARARDAARRLSTPDRRPAGAADRVAAAGRMVAARIPPAVRRTRRALPSGLPESIRTARWEGPVQWTRPALPRRPKAFPQQLLRAQSSVRISRGASPSTNRSPARSSCDLARRPRTSADGPGSLTDTGDPPHDPKGGRWLSVLLFRQRERAWESSPQLRCFPVVDAVHRVRGSLTVAVPLRRNWIGPVFPVTVAPHRSRIIRCA